MSIQNWEPFTSETSCLTVSRQDAIEMLQQLKNGNRFIVSNHNTGPVSRLPLDPPFKRRISHDFDEFYLCNNSRRALIKVLQEFIDNRFIK